MCVKLRLILKIMKLEAVLKVCHLSIQVHKSGVSRWDCFKLTTICVDMLQVVGILRTILYVIYIFLFFPYI